MSASKDLDEQIDGALTKLENSVEQSTLRRVANRQDVSNRTIHAASKQQLLALIEQREREARIAELKHIREFWGQAIDRTLSDKPFNFVALQDIDKRIESLKAGK